MADNTRKEFVMVTGGTSGIGYATVCRFLEEGYGVILMFGSDLDRAEGKRADLISKGYAENDDFIIVQADVSSEVSIGEAFSKLSPIVENVTVLINNAGALKRGDFNDLKIEDWQYIFGVNVFGLALMARWFSMSCSNAKVIINIGSIRGMAHVSRLNNMIYSASKACIPTLTAVLAKQLGPAIRVVAVVPGTIDTPQRQGISPDEFKLYGETNTILKRIGKPEEVANLCVFLASDKAGYITGTNITVDGGYSVNYIR